MNHCHFPSFCIVGWYSDDLFQSLSSQIFYIKRTN